MSTLHGRSRSENGTVGARARLKDGAEDAEHREAELRWLLELTQLPSASGREGRVIAWIRDWVGQRPELVLSADAAGNLVVEPRKRWGKKKGGGGRKGTAGSGTGNGTIFITAHLDHPAFVVERVIGPGTLEMSFRGGVMDEYFADAEVVVHAWGGDAGDERAKKTVRARLSGEGAGIMARGSDGKEERLFKTYLAEVEDGHEDQSDCTMTVHPAPAEREGLGDVATQGALETQKRQTHPLPPPSGRGSIMRSPWHEDVDVRVGDVATWALSGAEVDAQGIVHTLACDDLAAVAAALSAMDRLRLAVKAGEAVEDVRLLFTRSEEIGFTGAIAACKLGTMVKGSRVIALENSRSFPDSPIGGGPIVRVGDRLSIFDPVLTAACAKRAEQLAGKPSMPTATQKIDGTDEGWKWQRKLMAGGACEASVFCTYGYAATCLCLPLGNYHNMGELAAVQEGRYEQARLGPPRVAREYIHRRDYFGLVDLLVAIGKELPAVDPLVERIDKLYEKTRGVLGMEMKKVVKKVRKGLKHGGPRRATERKRRG